MGQEINQNVILQAIVELSNQLKDAKTELQQRIKDSCAQLTEKIDSVDAKVSVLSHDIVETRTDVFMLKQVKKFNK